MKNFICFVFVIGIVVDNGRMFGQAYSSNEVTMEPKCASAGGRCMKRAECPPGEIIRTQLCSKEGFTCCYGIPLSETRCGKFGGECMSSCNKRLFIAKAKDCEAGTQCCLLL